MHTFSFSYPWWYVLFCLITGVLYAYIMYFREKKFSDYSIWLKRTMALLRFMAVGLITFLLLVPFIKSVQEELKLPVLVIATDQSLSVDETNEENLLNKLNADMLAMQEYLAEKFDVKRVYFGSKVTEAPDSTQSKSTNIGHFLNYIEDQYSDQNLGAIVMATDGIYNEGPNPLYLKSGSSAPMYTIVLGDTTQKKDIYIQNVLYNRITYLGDKFPVQIDVSAFNCSGNTTKLIIESLENGRAVQVSNQLLQVDSPDFFSTSTLILDTNTPGIKRYRARIEGIAGEYNTKNNSRDFFVEVLDARQKILILANAPHPDLGALKNQITENKNYETEIRYMSDQNISVANYNLVILHNLPSENNNISSVLSEINKNNIPRIFIVGMQTSLNLFNQVQDVIQVQGNSKSTEEIQAFLNPVFSQFTTSESLSGQFRALPPLLTPFGTYKAKGTANIYLYQQIKKIKTDYPMIAFSDERGIRTTVICGEGIWRWRLFDYLQNQNYDRIGELVNKVVLLSSIKSDKRKFRTSTSKNLFRENEAILLDAQLYNDGYELVNDPDVRVVIKSEDNREFPFTFSKYLNYYTLDAGLFPPGTFRYHASVTFNGKILTSEGSFTVESIQLEMYDLTARHGLLTSLSEKTGGMMIRPQNIQALQDSLLKNESIKPVIYQSNTTKSIIHYRLLFFLILALLSAEWFFRRYFGSY